MPTRKRKATRRRANPKTVYDSTGKLFGKFKSKAAQIVARAIGGTVGKPLPKGRWVTLKAKRLKNGRIELRGKP